MQVNARSPLLNMTFVAMVAPNTTFKLIVNATDTRVFKETLDFLVVDGNNLPTRNAVYIGNWSPTDLRDLAAMRDGLISLRQQYGLIAFDIANSDAPPDAITLVPLPGTVVHGTDIVVYWVAPISLQNSSVDWIGLFLQGAPNTTYLDYVFVNSNISNSHVFNTSSLAPGTYEFRYLLNNGYTSVATSRTFLVT